MKNWTFWSSSGWDWELWKKLKNSLFFCFLERIKIIKKSWKNEQRNAFFCSFFHEFLSFFWNSIYLFKKCSQFIDELAVPAQKTHINSRSEWRLSKYWLLMTKKNLLFSWDDGYLCFVHSFQKQKSIFPCVLKVVSLAPFLFVKFEKNFKISEMKKNPQMKILKRMNFNIKNCFEQ